MLLIIDCGYKYIHQLQRIVDDYEDAETIAIYDLNPEKLGAYQGIIISSAQITVENNSFGKYLEKLMPILATDLPILGIGIGHHLLGLLHQALPSYQSYTYDFQKIAIIADSPLFDRLPLDIEMMADHAGTISIPPGFNLLASSDKSINESMQHTEKPYFGVQFLPELSGNHGGLIIENFIKITQEK